MIKTEITNEASENYQAPNPYFFGASVIVVVCAIVLIALLASGVNKSQPSANHSIIANNVSALPLASPSGSSITPGSNHSPTQAENNAGTLSSQSYNLQNNLPSGTKNKPTTNSIQSSGQTTGQTINNTYPY